MTPVANRCRPHLQLIKFIHRCFGGYQLLNIFDHIRNAQNNKQLWRYVYDSAASLYRY